MRINLGCGQSPTKEWRNFDNSFSLHLAKIPLLRSFIYHLGIIDESQYRFMKFASDNKIEYGDATRGLPLAADACDVVYSSHMLEHLDQCGADKFIIEAYRVLRPNGVLRIVIPDLKKLIVQYCESGDADAFVEATHMCVSMPVTILSRLRLLLIGFRHHQWMYDASSLCRLLERHGFVEVNEMPAGKTNISNAGCLDLYERSSESLYVEAKKPSG